MLNGVLAFSAYNVPLIKSGVRHDSVEPIADKWLKDKQVLLHTDSARAYKAKTRGALHASVVHKKRQDAPGVGRWKVGVGAAYIRQDDEGDLAQPKASDCKGRDASCRPRMEIH